MQDGVIITEWQKRRLKENRRGVSGRPAPPEISSRTFDSVLGKTHNINKLFFSFLKKLNRFLPINRAALAISSDRDKTLKVIALKGEEAREGLALTLPEDNSLLYRVYRSRALYTADMPFYFSGNFIERKILLDSETRAVMVTPLLDGGQIYGVVGLSSPREAAFEDCSHGTMERIFQKLGIAIGDLAPLLNI